MSLYNHIKAPAPRYLLRLSVLSRLIAQYINGTGKRFLEIGPGLGDVSSFLAEHKAIDSGVIIDRAEKSVAIVQQRMNGKNNIDVRCADILDIDDGIFDYVLSFEVLEHIDNDRDFMQHVFEKVAVGGYWFISVPAYMKKWQKQDEFSGHVRRYEEAEMRSKLVAAGFEVVELIDYGFPLTSIMRPFRDRYYVPDEESTKLEKTLESGTEKRLFSKKSPWLMMILLFPFVLLQAMFSFLKMGDGFIVVAKRNA